MDIRQIQNDHEVLLARMAALRDLADAYGRWRAADDIAAAPERFRRDLHAILDALEARIAREHATLLPLAATL